MRKSIKKIRPYLNQFIIKVPADEQFDFQPDDDPNVVVPYDDIKAMNMVFIDRVAGSQDNLGKKLWLGQANCNRGDLTSFIATHELDWTVSAFEGEKIIQNRVLSHLLPDVDDLGNDVPILDCTDRLNTIAGHKWTY